eukprot:6806350-Alexandrium_andersonii.AAC.1
MALAGGRHRASSCAPPVAAEASSRGSARRRCHRPAPRPPRPASGNLTEGEGTHHAAVVPRRGRGCPDSVRSRRLGGCGPDAARCFR